MSIVDTSGGLPPDTTTVYCSRATSQAIASCSTVIQGYSCSNPSMAGSIGVAVP